MHLKIFIIVCEILAILFRCEYIDKMSNSIAQVSCSNYRKTSNISHTLVGNEIVDHLDVVGAAPTTSSFST